MKDISISYSKEHGFSIIEAVVGILLAALTLIAFTSLISQTIKINNANAAELKAVMYLQELIEVAKDLEQSDWASIAASVCSTPCHPEISADAWIFLANEQTLEDGLYARSLTIEDVYRNQLAFPNEIVEIPGVNDPNTKKVIATISWQDGFQAKNLTLETYLYNYTP